MVRVLTNMTKSYCLGYEDGRIRPGRLGQWDVYRNAHNWGLTEDQCILISGLPADEVGTESEKAKIILTGFDPDDNDQVEAYRYMTSMTLAEAYRRLAEE